MRNIIIILVVFLLFLSCGTGQGDTFLYKGDSWPMVSTPEQMVTRIKKGRAVALRFRLEEYKAVLMRLAADGIKKGVAVRDRINDDLLVCASCRRALGARERFEMLLSGKSGKKSCPACSSGLFILFSTRKPTR